MISVFLRVLESWIFDYRGGLKAKVATPDVASRMRDSNRSPRTEIMKFHGFKNALFRLRILKIQWFLDAISKVDF